MLEATQTGVSSILFKAGRQWEGRVIGNFRLRQYLGSTEHSAVFLTELNGDESRKAAIKLIAAESTDADVQLGRWRLAAKLSHPHLLQIHEVGRSQISGDELLFVVTECADETLSQILPERPLSEKEAREMLRPILDALSYVHENGFAHCRLRPANIMVVGEQVKISSDGISRTGAASTTAGPYEPPEASQQGLTPAGDVWSLGMILVEALTQKLPVWENRLLDEPRVPEEVNEPFAEISRHCLLREPRSRWDVSHIFTRLEPPVSTPRPARELKLPNLSKSEKAKNDDAHKKDITTRIFAVSMVAVIVIAVLLASLLRHGARRSAGAAEQAQAANDSSIAKVPVVQEHIIQQPLPTVPDKALRTIHGRIKIMVRLHVDSAGNVTRAEFDNRGPSRYFANAAMQAAQQWKFAPAQAGKASRVWLLQFVFENSGVTVHPRQVT